MKPRVAVLLVLAVLGGCSGIGGKNFNVQFQPYSSDLDLRAQQSIQAAAAFAKVHPLMPLSLAGYANRLDPSQFETLRQQRVTKVQDALMREGVDQIRIEVLGNGILYPEGVSNLPTDQVAINIGL